MKVRNLKLIYTFLIFFKNVQENVKIALTLQIVGHVVLDISSKIHNVFDVILIVSHAQVQMIILAWAAN